MNKFFLNKLNLKPYSDFIYFEKLDTSVSKTGQSNFCDFGFWLEFLPSWFLDTF
jgi:hypothetical protein